ncbi:nucleotidyltransferase family protein [Dysgonomonas macrotermitis]|uniref:Nucleotidyl transferase n=1 Tax=Dysgonomonas macrotermitis TaxID=1346286 RepID=A0A1M5I3H8_9BACT|nr:nucleotidyltransferase family protein [Dysgonomonas macrotermitis]SHG22874.1 Nucleotidyl transferase [Dysgonomonas macrotermitis]
MIDQDKFIIKNTASLLDALVALNKLSNDVLTLFVVNEEGVLLGTLTDGDVRRRLIDGYTLESGVLEVMNSHYHYISEGQIDVPYLKMLKNKGIVLIPVLDDTNKIQRILNLKNKKSILPIDVVLMAGGKGERLRPLTEKIPKPLLKVGDKSIIDHNIDRLIDYGVDNINVTVNYLKEQLIEHFRNPLPNGVKVNCVSEPCFLGTMGSIKFVSHFASDYILVMNSDLFTNINYEELFLHFLEHNADMSVVAVPYTISIPYGIFDLEGRNIKGVQEKPILNYYANAGIYLFKKKFLDLIPDSEFFNATDLIDSMIENKCKVVRFPLTGYWIDIGKHEEYKKAQELIKHL